MSTTAESAISHEELNRWARIALSVAEHATREQTDVAILSMLDENDFMPAPITADAIAILSGSTTSGAELIAQAEDALAEEIETFATRYFETDPAERRTTWQALSTRAAHFPALCYRLSHLRRGLDVTLSSVHLAPRSTRHLGLLVSDLFVLRPAARARLRRKQLAELFATSAEWETAGRDLQKRCPAVAELEPEFVEEATNRVRNERRRARKQVWKRRWSAIDDVTDRGTNWMAEGAGVWVFIFASLLVGIVMGILNDDDGPPTPNFPRTFPTGRTSFSSPAARELDYLLKPAGDRTADDNRKLLELLEQNEHLQKLFLSDEGQEKFQDYLKAKREREAQIQSIPTDELFDLGKYENEVASDAIRATRILYGLDSPVPEPESRTVGDHSANDLLQPRQQKLP